MKYQSQHDLIDPEVPPPETVLESTEEHDPGVPNDAYVIGELGNTVKVLDAKAATGRRGRKQWAKPVGAALGALFVAMTVWNLNRLLQNPPPLPKPSAFQIKQALYLSVMKIEAYRQIHGVTPSSLTDAGVFEAGAYEYTRIDLSHYVVSFQGDGPKLEYDSNQSKDRFFGSPQEILTMGVSK
jgi:hypothetical protein